MVELLTLGAIGILFAAAACDIAERRIPNGLVLTLVAIGLARILWGLATGEGALTPGADAAGALATFAVGAVLFHLGLVGGGDVKLVAAAALWLGAAAVWPFLLVTAVAGGALAVLFLVRAALAGLARDARPSLPYGVAIAAGGILASLTRII